MLTLLCFRRSPLIQPSSIDKKFIFVWMEFLFFALKSSYSCWLNDIIALVINKKLIKFAILVWNRCLPIYRFLYQLSTNSIFTHSNAMKDLWIKQTFHLDKWGREKGQINTFHSSIVGSIRTILFALCWVLSRCETVQFSLYADADPTQYDSRNEYTMNYCVVWWGFVQFIVLGRWWGRVINIILPFMGVPFSISIFHHQYLDSRSLLLSSSPTPPSSFDLSPTNQPSSTLFTSK